MRILHVIPSVAAVRGGPSQAVLELVKTDRHLGYHSEIVTTNDDGPGLLDVPLLELVDYEGAQVRFFPRFSPPLRPVREFAYSRKLGGWLTKHAKDYDLIHVHALYSYAASIAMQIARGQGVPYINRPSGLLCRWILQQNRIRKSAFLALLDRKNLNGAAAIEFTAEHEREEASDLGISAPSFVMPYGLNIEPPISDAKRQLRQRLNLGDEPILLFLSRLHPKKGLDRLLEALVALASRPFSVIIAGSGAPDYEEQLRRQVAAGPLNERVHFVGFASGAWKQVLLQGADLFVLPSFSESFAIAVMEALSAGLPVVTTHGVPLASLVQKFDLGWVCQPEVDSLKEGIALFLDAFENSANTASRSQRARQLIANNFPWPRIASQLQSVYSCILNKQKPLPTFELGAMAVQALEHDTSSA